MQAIEIIADSIPVIMTGFIESLAMYSSKSILPIPNTLLPMIALYAFKAQMAVKQATIKTIAETIITSTDFLFQATEA
jgi:hypothetical protein